MQKISYFLEVEGKYDLYNKQILDVNYWNYERMRLFNYDICANALDLNESHKGSFKSFKDVLYKSIIFFFRNSHQLLCCRNLNSEVLIFSHERRIKEGDYYICPYTYVISQHYGEKACVIEKPYEGNHFSPVLEINMYYLDSILLSAKAYSLLHRKLKTPLYKKIKKQLVNELELPLSLLESYYDWHPTYNTIYERFIDTILLCKIEKKKLEKIVKRISPRIIIETVGYGRTRMILNEIAKEYHIPTVELQHGTIYENHAAYQYCEKDTIRQFPDYIFTFSEFWNKRMNSPIASEKIIAVGYPYFEKICDNYKLYANDEKRITIMFVSQGTIGKKLSELAVMVAQRLPASSYRIIFKLHPDEIIMWKQEYTQLANTVEIEVVGREKGIYELFSQCDIQIGVYSTAIYEGLGFGLTTLIYKIGHYEDMKCLIDSGYAHYVDNIDETINMIKAFDKEKASGRNDGADSFWKKDSKNTMIKQIDAILSRYEEENNG